MQVLSRAPIRESEAGRALHAVANRWVPPCGMAFEWSALRQPRGSHVACLVGLNPTMTREGRERSTRSASANIGRWQARTLVSKASGILTDVWIETNRLPQSWSVNPAGSGGCLESRPCGLPHVTRAHRAPPILGRSS